MINNVTTICRRDQVHRMEGLAVYIGNDKLDNGFYNDVVGDTKNKLCHVRKDSRM